MGHDDTIPVPESNHRGDAIAPEKINTLREFYTPVDGQIHEVTESTLNDLLDNYSTIYCPAGKTLSIDSTITFDSGRGSTRLISPTVTHWTGTGGQFSLKPSGDFPSVTFPSDPSTGNPDQGVIGFRGVEFNGVNISNTKPVVDISEVYSLDMFGCSFIGGGQYGIKVSGEGMLNSNIAGCRFRNHSDAGIFDDDSGITQSHIGPGNFFGEFNMSDAAIVADRFSSGTVIYGNIINQTTGHGIEIGPTLGGDLAGNRQVVVSDNTIHGVGGDGIKAGVGAVIPASNNISSPGGQYVNAPGAKNAGVVADSYTGDGTQNRRIQLNFRPRVVYVEEAGGTLHEVRDDSLSLINGTSPTGELSIQDDGFEVGDNGADADPNTNTETYQYVAIE